MNLKYANRVSLWYENNGMRREGFHEIPMNCIMNRPFLLQALDTLGKPQVELITLKMAEIAVVTFMGS